MSIAEIKIEIQKLILEEENKNVLQYLRQYITVLKNNSNENWGQNISKEEELKLLNSLEQIENNETIHHSQVKDEFQKKYPHLNL